MPKGSTPRTYLPGMRPEDPEPVDETPNDVKYARWPPKPRPAPTLSRTFLPLARAHGGVTIAHVMAAESCTMRAALDFLDGLTRDGRVLRYPATRDKPIIWCLPRADA